MAMPTSEPQTDDDVVKIPWVLGGDFGEVKIEMCIEQAENFRDKLDEEIQSVKS